MIAAAYPLQWPQGWPRTADGKRRTGSPFKISFERARLDLEHELRLLGARDTVISTCLPLRRDGAPVASRHAVSDPGVAVFFTLHSKQMVLARDTFASVADNLRSVGLAIAHLRGLERHGGAPMLERAFEGFTALPMTGEAAGPSCWEILDVKPGAAREAIEAKFRELAKTAHPDLGGSHEAFNRIRKARDEALRA